MRHRTNSRTMGRGALLAICCLCALAVPAAADDAAPDFDYDIFFRHDTLVVWLDVRPILDQAKMEDLLAGLDVYIGIEIKLEKPRPLLAKTIGEKKAAVLLSHDLTEDAYRLEIADLGIEARDFFNQPEMSDFLADSVVFTIIPQSRLEPRESYRLKLNMICKSYSHNTLGARDEFPADSLTEGTPQGDDLLNDVFNLFLDIIGFGRTSYKLTSGPFRPHELTSSPR